MKIFVGNLSWKCKDQDLEELFRSYGEVVSAKHMTDRETGKARGFGFVEMADADAKKAITALDGREFMGRDINVNEARPREERAPQRGDRRW